MELISIVLSHARAHKLVQSSLSFGSERIKSEFSCGLQGHSKPLCCAGADGNSLDLAKLKTHYTLISF